MPECVLLLQVGTVAPVDGLCPRCLRPALLGCLHCDVGDQAP